MRIQIFIYAFVVMSFGHIYAQTQVNPLFFMVGKWKGNGWMITQSGKQFSEITETVVCKLDCAVLAVEGIGTKLDTTTQKQITVHNAFGVISKDIKSTKWVMRAYKNGGVVDAEIVFVNEKIIRWELPIPYNGGMMRFTTDFSTPDRWKEIGEFTKDGKNWVKMMESELTKVQH